MKLKALLKLLALLTGTSLVCLLVFEFFVFKHILPASDNIPNAYIDNVIRFKPNTKARLYEPDGTSQTIKINAQGWNSTKNSYKQEKTKGTTRIAVIGDSYVQAELVNIKEAFPEILEQELNKKGHKTEVYRFGIDGAPLSQYLYMLRKEVVKYNPDIVVIQLVHNDFDESYHRQYGRYASSFMRINLEDDTIKEIAPQPYKPGLVDRLKTYRTFRYIYYQTGLSVHIRHLVNLTKDPENATTKAPQHGFIQSDIDVHNITELGKINRATNYALQEMKKLSQKHNFKLLLSMDAVREGIYTGNPATEYQANQLNIVAKETAKKHAIPFLDLTDAMSKSYKENKQRFEFSWSWHWNKKGNEIAGKAIAKQIELQFLEQKFSANNKH